MVNWSTEHLILPRAFLNLTVSMGQPEGTLAVEYPNKGNLDSTQYKIELISESFSNYSYRAISERKGLVKVSDLLREATKSSNDNINQQSLAHLNWLLQQATSITTTLVKLAIAGVGDRGLYNVLANTNTYEVFCIDIEECHSGNINCDPWFYMSKPPSASYREVWNSYVDWMIVRNNILNTVPNTAPYYHVVLPLIDRMIACVNPTPHPIPNFAFDVGPVQPTFSFAQATSSNVIQTSPVPLTLGKMSYSFRHSTTFSGYPDDEIRSGLQKYIRRGEVMKAVQCGTELFRMPEVNPEAKRIRTNLYNRLLVIATEDIGPGDTSLCIAVMEYLFIIKDQGSNDKESFHELVAVIQTCAESPKTRVLSHLWRVYAVPPGQEIAEAKGITIDPLTLVPQHNSWPGSAADPPILIYLASMFAEKVAQHSPTSFTWLGRYLDACASNSYKIAKLRRRTNPVEALWIILQAHISERDYEILRNAYYYLSENRGTLMMATFLAVWQFRSQAMTKIGELATLWKTSPLLLDLQQGNYQLILDDYVVDKHTKRGRRDGKDRNDFVYDGALVDHRAPFFEQEWFLLLEEIYKIS